MSIRTVISQIVFVACVLFGIGIDVADAWVKGGAQPFLDGEAPVVLHGFCRLSSGASSSSFCGRDSDQRWVDMIQTATSEWNNAGADFVFQTRAGRASADPCRIRDAVVVIFASHDNLCPQDRHFPIQFEYGGFTVKEYGGNWARIYIFHVPLVSAYAYSLLLHELGHVVGLDHPDEAGQNVVAVMNSRVTYASLQQDDIAGIRGLHGTRQVLTGYLENPGPDSFHSGIGVISGWVCDAEKVEIEITTARGRVFRFDAAYGTERADTAGECGDTDNGFGLLFNWNLLSGGEHEVIAFVDGEELGRAMISVTIPGMRQTPDSRGDTWTEFLRGATGECLVGDFPYPRFSGRFRWNQGTQHLELVEVLLTPERPVLGHLTTHFDGTWQFTPRITPSDNCMQQPDLDFVFTCTIVNGVVQCGDGVLQGTVAEGGAFSSISFFGTSQGQFQGNRGSGTWQNLAIPQELAGCSGTWTAMKQ